MAYQIGFVDNSVKLASHAFLDTIHALATANGWVAVEDLRTGDTPSMILRGPGNLDYQDVYVGFRCYHDVEYDFYNMGMAIFNGYVPGATWDNQPQATSDGTNLYRAAVPLHNLRVDYWLMVNDLRICFGVKLGTPIYAHGYAGLLLPYATPGQNTYPVFLGGAWGAELLERFSDNVTQSIGENSAYHMPYKGTTANARIRTTDNRWVMPDIWPWNNSYMASTTNMRDSGGSYPLFPCILNTSALGMIGELDGVYYIPGFNNASENTLVIGGVTYVVLQAINQVGLADFVALRMS